PVTGTPKTLNFTASNGSNPPEGGVLTILNGSIVVATYPVDFNTPPPSPDGITRFTWGPPGDDCCCHANGKKTKDNLQPCHSLGVYREGQEAYTIN
ncbi:hypothetical protein MEO41_28625, partial [Dolichospermum sp. ST_sed4]|nr:hypothetical protein [Dolichospermum sp. ST_sed4]